MLGRARVEASDESNHGGLSSRASCDGQEEESDDAIRAKLKAHMERVLSVDEGNFPTPQQQPGEGDSDHPLEEETFEFRLFASSAKGGGAAVPQKVVLVPDDLEAVAGGGAFVVPSRPLSYYLPGDPTPEETEMFRTAAVSGEDVLLRSAQRCWGLEVPWRVTKVTATRKEMRALLANAPREEAVASSGGSDEDEAAAEVQQRKRRPGKKRRIALRTKERALHAAEKSRREKLDAEEKMRVSKEEHLREKNKRLNREKKLKRRQKERDKKQASKAVLGEANSTVEMTA